LLKKLTSNDTVNLVFEPFWFNSKEYAEKQATGENYIFFQEDKEKQLILRLYKIGDRLISPFRAPFGSIEFSNETDIKTIFEFMKEVISSVKLNKDIKEISITAPPECYNLLKADLTDEALIHSGFSVSVTELNYHLDTEMGDFENFVHDSEKRRLKKCLNAGFECSVETNPDYPSIHQLISDCRLRKGHPLSMNAADFEKMFLDFPESYVLFVVKDKGKIIAAAVGVKVNAAILYNFLPADHEDYLAYSPMVLLNKGMYDYCRENNYQIYDLGIATSGGIRNEGLIRFKEHLGGKLSHKYSYEIKLNEG
jgi:hypothetical protein